MLPLRNTGKKNRKEKKKRKEIDYLPPAGESRGHVGGHSLAVHVGGHSLDVMFRRTPRNTCKGNCAGGKLEPESKKRNRRVRRGNRKGKGGTV